MAYIDDVKHAYGHGTAVTKNAINWTMIKSQDLLSNFANNLQLLWNNQSWDGRIDDLRNYKYLHDWTMLRHGKNSVSYYPIKITDIFYKNFI